MIKSNRENVSLNQQLKEKLSLIGEGVLSRCCKELALSSNSAEYNNTHRKLDSLIQRRAFLSSMESLLVKAKRANASLLEKRLNEYIQVVNTMRDIESHDDFTMTSIGQHLIDFTYEYPLRSPCPLCNATPLNGDDGFLVPGGIRMHLEGGGNARQCKVRKIIDDLYDNKNDDRPYKNWRN